MSYIQPKTDYKDGDILYGIDLNASNAVIKAGVDDNFDRIQGLDSTKQDNLTAGAGIDITDNVISSTSTIADWGDIEGNIDDQTDLKDALDAKQDVIDSSNKLDYSLLDNTPTIPSKTSDLTNDSGFIDNTYHDSSKQDTLTAGTGIDITNNVISNTQTSAEWGNITGTLSDQTDLNTALGGKQETLVSGTNIKTINNYSLLGSGNIDISGGGGSNNQVYYVPDNTASNPFIWEDVEPGLYQFGYSQNGTNNHTNIHSIKMKAHSSNTDTASINTTDGKVLVARKVNSNTPNGTPVIFYVSGEFGGIRCAGTSDSVGSGISHLSEYDIGSASLPVDTDSVQTISGLKTFSTLPQASISPDSNYDLVNKYYVDSHTGDYSPLSNKPQINNVTLSGNKSLSDLGINIPTKLSDLTNDNNTVTDASYVHTDNNYTSAEKTKLSGIEAGAQVNVSEVVVGSTTTSDTVLQIESNDLDFQGLDTTAIVDLIYPVGSIYMSVNSTSPSTLFGGTWVAWGTGRVPVGVDTTQTEFDTTEKTGGSKYLQDHEHKKEMYWSHAGNSYGYRDAFPYSNDKTEQTTNIFTGSVYGTTTGNSGNLQPYITCYMWKRTA